MSETRFIHDSPAETRVSHDFPEPPLEIVVGPHANGFEADGKR